MNEPFDLDTAQPQRTNKTSKFLTAFDLDQGDYSGAVKSAAMKRIKSLNKSLFEINVDLNGVNYQLSYWLDHPQNLIRALTNMQAIGFDSDQWGPEFSRPFKLEFDKSGALMVGDILFFTISKNAKGYIEITLKELTEAQPSMDELPF